MPFKTTKSPQTGGVSSRRCDLKQQFPRLNLVGSHIYCCQLNHYALRIVVTMDTCLNVLVPDFHSWKIAFVSVLGSHLGKMLQKSLNLRATVT